ncbi:hypothetical protein A3H80_01190 [Candidatus Roizmanbacteria bacterium RIFCSPLOWO2_02_FULL_37_19]|uniref:Uncharacterized protein n=1 Tax=Candidatus Roizmanbacteria bacterium RIFCSPHIGHO2_02_FULL_37_24 TaxID=1802037 RepID=A0A1F7GVQ2_9BACT|nr:MAG: hypothetical protein A2862_00605 [Candidatus Roizmanbacteria bacterium RIFCSPHIGHO2_01_FULL_38_41]OGK22552.1 MAG: hypothetical protein A3C24_05310 [Candidatus Roizmanbacteria bacterium RIFCSPHIGHO2_02_FULL_37_24]OGK33952.1 MAG: hypothetical protein A3E10_02095 [Candidatus Roizmanbacteria bacterium RIFCSPHIGHO2_12_FULL_37_23]OGK43630.1 MAG: hypothetical protein A2956_03970 [Candidatus Roizmanbacteria bacterium RIFCSPLOWO2_01_FULL_37_57]OGK54215.1 MAG: hypothetical protein A3H80_01190 [Ca
MAQLCDHVVAVADDRNEVSTALVLLKHPVRYTELSFSYAESGCQRRCWRRRLLCLPQYQRQVQLPDTIQADHLEERPHLHGASVALHAVAHDEHDGHAVADQALQLLTLRLGHVLERDDHVVDPYCPRGAVAAELGETTHKELSLLGSLRLRDWRGVRVTDAHARIDDEGDDDQRQDADGVHERVSFGW